MDWHSGVVFFSIFGFILGACVMKLFHALALQVLVAVFMPMLMVSLVYWIPSFIYCAVECGNWASAFVWSWTLACYAGVLIGLAARMICWALFRKRGIR